MAFLAPLVGALGGTGSALGLAGGALGAIGGAQGSNSSQTSQVILGPQSSFDQFLSGSQGSLSPAMESDLQNMKRLQASGLPGSNDPNLAAAIQKLEAQKQAGSKPGYLQNLFGQMSGLVNAGPGQGDVTASLNASRGLASMLGDYAKTGGLPGASDISTANQFTNDIFAAQQTGLNQQFDLARQDAARQAALSGRGSFDPILRSRLLEQQTNQQNLLNSQKTGFSAQFAQNLPLQRLGFAGQQADLLSQLSSQALQNRASLYGLGQSALNSERGFRLDTATRTAQGQSGGGIGGAITGALGGAGAGLGLANGLAFNSALNNFKVQGGGSYGGGSPASFGIPYAGYGAVNAGPSLPNGSYLSSGGGFFGSQPIFQAYPNFPGAGGASTYFGAPYAPGYMGR